MKIPFSLLLILFAIILSTTSTYAVPATPHPITVIQPDGTELTIRLHGDEFFKYKTSVDGYALVPDTKGVLHYAEMDATGTLIPSQVKANNIEKRSAIERKFVTRLTPNINLRKQNLLKRAIRSAASGSDSLIQKAYPVTGTPKSLVILVNFSDKSFVTTTPQASYTNLLNQSGYSSNGGTGSARDYFMASSYGKFSPTFDVVGPVTLPQTLDYYGKNQSNGDDTNAQQMVIDACTAANIAGVDFTQYDTDNNGVLDNVFVYYAGYNEAEGAAENTIWPHRWAVYSGNKFDGKTLRDYACTSELKGTYGSNMCGVGTFCHEFGHVLGLVDYYHTTEDKNTLNLWDIMDGGAYSNGGRTPPAYSAYDRFFLGYLTPQEVKIGSNLTLKPLYQGTTTPANTDNQSFLFSATTHNLIGNNPSPKEFFLVEYRKKIGWDLYLPGEGMLIWHIDYDQTAWNNNEPNNYTGTTQTANSHMRVYLQPLSGSSTTPGSAFTTGSFTPTTWEGTNINREITNIVKTADNINFRLMGGGYQPVITAPSEVPKFTTVQGTPSVNETIIISGKRLTSNIILSFRKNFHFEIKKETDPETAWAKTITLVQNVDSIVNNVKVMVRYNPAIPSFSEIHLDSIVLKSNNAETLLVSLSGNSSRPVYVVPPISTEPSEITVYSFIANWEPTYDATGYYLTAYNISEGSSELNEGFDKGLKAPKDWIITAIDTTTSSTYSGKAIPAVQFKNTGEIIQTEKYLLPVKGLSFYIRSLNGTGSVLVEAWNGTSWNTVDNLQVISTLNTIKTYAFDAVNNYLQFRFTYTKIAGATAIDDITVAFIQKLEYNAREQWVTNASDTLMNLVANREYFYKVRATDRFVNLDKSIKYENITDFSNTVQLRTLENKAKAKTLIATVDLNGIVTVITPSTNEIINIYNMLGQHVRSITANYNKVEISDLPRRQAYILQSGSLRTKIVL